MRHELFVVHCWVLLCLRAAPKARSLKDVVRPVYLHLLLMGNKHAQPMAVVMVFYLGHSG